MNSRTLKTILVPILVVSLTASLLSVVGCPSPTSDQSTTTPTLSWHIEVVDATTEVVQYTSMALDSYDHPHFSYWDYTNEDLKYVRWTGIEWDGLDGTPGPDSVDTAGDVGGFNSIALDSNDYPHISYDRDYSLTEGELKYVRWSGSVWDGLDGTAGPDVVDSNGDVGEESSIALDSNDRPHISYKYDNNDDLKYVRWTGAAWDGLDGPAGADVVDTEDSVGWDICIALDSNDLPHITYSNATSPDSVMYVYWTGTAWDGLDGTTGPDIVGAGQESSIAIDDSGYPHISYLDLDNGSLVYLRWTGTAWDGLDGTAGLDTVDTGGVGANSSIALDASGYPHISYYDYTNGSLKYVRWNGTLWDGFDDTTGPDIIDDTGSYTNNESSIAIDTSGYPHIGYSVTSGWDLKYARYGE